MITYTYKKFMSFYNFIWTETWNEWVLDCFIMAMPFNMILILCVISNKLSCDFNKLTISYTCTYIPLIFMTNITFLYVNKISVCMSVTFVHK